MRRRLLTARSQLTPSFRKFAAQQVTAQIKNLIVFQRAQHIAFYLPVKNEIDPLGLLSDSIHKKKKCYLPVLHPLNHNRLYFAHYHPSKKLQSNRFGILEPPLSTRTIIPAWALDLVIVPLVGFDKTCQRLGMGGGFYDRTFAFKNKKVSKRPVLMGIAYEIQKVDQLKNNPWDIPLDLIVTEAQLYVPLD